MEASVNAALLPEGRKVLLVAGPESSATRLFLEALARHPCVHGHAPAGRDHGDVLDGVWEALEAGDVETARLRFADLEERDVIATRRSFPHGRRPGEAARYLEFVDLDRFASFCRAVGRELIVLVTVRSPAANLASWIARRASPQGSPEKAMRQYQAAYRAIFAAIGRSGCPFLLLPYEALLCDGESYLRSIFRLLGLPDRAVPIEIRPGRNQAGYERLLASQP